jgi:hypothetical protein
MDVVFGAPNAGSRPVARTVYPIEPSGGLTANLVRLSLPNSNKDVPVDIACLLVSGLPCFYIIYSLIKGVNLKG